MRRRQFVQASAALAIGGRILGANERVQVAIVGIGGRGRAHINSYTKLPECQVVAVCDVNQAAQERGQAMVRQAGQENPKAYKNMKEVFADKGVDAVSFATPNHWHALGTIWAVQAGKDVYVEKPASHNVFEGHQMVAAARKYGRMVQIGSQSRSIPHKMKAIQLLHEGIIGKVYQAKGLCYKRRPSIGRKPDQPVPPGLDWDGFLGPAPMRPFNELRFAYNWHWFWDTGNGDIGNQGIHEMDIARWSLNRGLPTSVVSTGGKYVYDDDQETPNTQFARFDYGDAEIHFEVRGLLTGPEASVRFDGSNCIGSIFQGSEGYMVVDGSKFQVFKGEKRELVMEEKSGGNENALHMGNFLKAVKSRKQSDLNADVEIGVVSADLVHLANISYRMGGKQLKFDPAKLQFVNDAQANAMLTRKYRAPYLVPAQV
jgi:predicted dehydrogenase